MSDLGPLLASPDDDAPRLVWADAHLEAGDLQGELVTTQCELSRLGLDPPRLYHDWLRDGLASDEKSTPRVKKLLEREAKLLREHQKAWAGPVAAKQDPVFRRGFVEHLALSMRAHTLEAAYDAAPLLQSVHHHFDLTAKNLRAFFSVPDAKRLRELYVPFQVAMVAPLTEAPPLASLRRLMLNVSGGEHDLSTLAHAPFHATLEALVVASFALDASVTRATFAGMKALSELQLIDSRLGPTGVAALAALDLPNLSILSVRAGKLGDEGARTVRDAPFASRLRALDLRKNLLGDVGPVLARCTALAVLELSGNPIGGSLGSFVGVPHEHLDVLGLESCGLGDDDVRALVSAPFFSRLDTLDLRKNRLTDASARLIADADTRLRNLFVGGNALTKKGKDALSSLAARVYA